MNTTTPRLRHQPPTPLISHGQSPPRRRTTRKVAEWVSLALSIAIVGGLAVVLVRDALSGNGAFVVPSVTVLEQDIRQQGATWIVPVRVDNDAPRTLHDLDVELSHVRGGEPPQTDSVTLDYLGRGCSETVYFYLPHDPRAGTLHGKALHYRLD